MKKYIPQLAVGPNNLPGYKVIGWNGTVIGYIHKTPPAGWWELYDPLGVKMNMQILTRDRASSTLAYWHYMRAANATITYPRAAEYPKES